MPNTLVMPKWLIYGKMVYLCQIGLSLKYFFNSLHEYRIYIASNKFIIICLVGVSNMISLQASINLKEK